MKSVSGVLLLLLLASCSHSSSHPTDASDGLPLGADTAHDGASAVENDAPIPVDLASAPDASADVGLAHVDSAKPPTLDATSSRDGMGDGQLTEDTDNTDPKCIVHVARGGSDTNDGTSWSSAFASVQPAITAGTAKINAGSCTSVEVWVAKGTYTPTYLTDANDPRSAAFCLAANVALYGGFAGSESSRNARSVASNVTTLSGDIGVAGEKTDNSYHVVIGANGATIDGFTITGGFASGKQKTSAENGGGMYNESTSPAILKCTFSGNSATAGGAMYNASSSPVVTDCTFSDNSAAIGAGGGMYNIESSPILTNCTFSSNTADLGGGMYNYMSGTTLALTNCTFSGNSANNGGGMYNDAASPAMTSCVFMDNQAKIGGGVYNSSSSPVATSCTFSRNWAGNGGGMYNDSGGPTVVDSTFSANTAPSGGGGMYNRYVTGAAVVRNCTFSNNTATRLGGGMVNYNSSSPQVMNCTFSGNSVTGDGGGMANYDTSSPSVTNCRFSGNTATALASVSAAGDGGGMFNHNTSSPTVTNCTFSDNSASSGGGICNDLSSPTVTNSTFSRNSAKNNGAGIANFGSRVTLLNDILWGDSASSSGTEIYDDKSSYSAVTFSVVAGGFDGTGNSATDPLLNPDLTLQAGSPAIDGGGCGATVIATDILGHPRWDIASVANATGENGVDMGAFEYQGDSGMDAVISSLTCR